MKEHIIVLDSIKKCNVGAGLAPALVMKEHIIVLDTIKKCNVGAGLAPALVMKEHIVVLDSIKLWTITQGKGLPVAHPSAASPTSFEKLSARDPSLLV